MKKLLILLGFLALPLISSGATLQPFQGGTGFATTSASNVGKFLQVSTTTPFLGYTFASGGSGSFTTTTINGLSTTAYTFSTSSDTNLHLYLTTSGGNMIIFNPQWAGTLADSRITSAGTWNGMTPSSTQVNVGVGLQGGGALTSSIQISIATSTQQMINSAVSSSTQVIAGTGLRGGGSLTGNVTLWEGISFATSGNPIFHITSSSGAFGFVGDGVSAITAGTNITLSSSTGNVTINSTGGGTPGGATTQIQYNNANAFGGDAGLVWSSSTQKMTVGNLATSSLVIGSSFGTSTQSTLYNATGTYTYTVPVGATQLIITTVGGQGGAGSQSCTGCAGGAGGVATGTMVVTPGTNYYVLVGDQGNATTGRGGFGGGGNGSLVGGAIGGGGGGMSYVSATSTGFATSTVIIVGAGGGGGGGELAASNGAGGDGGGLTGTNGSPAATYPATAFGGGATQTSGGTCAGGTSVSYPCKGSGGQGGNASSTPGNLESGGGGGGFFGGGAAGGATSTVLVGGGGGGSSYVSSTVLTATSTASGGNTGIGYVVITAFVTNSAPASSTLMVGGHITAGGFLPGVSSCGTSPSVVGSDTAGKITVGSGSASSCTLTFARQFVNPPACTIGSNTAIANQTVTTTSSTLVIGGTALINDVIPYICVDY